MHLLINFILALILDSAGFVMYVYFFSIGYGLSVAGLAAAMLFMFRGSLLPAHVRIPIIRSSLRRNPNPMSLSA